MFESLKLCDSHDACNLSDSVICRSVYLRYTICIHTIQQTDMGHVYVGLAQARPNCWLNGRCEGRKLRENLSYSLLANAELSTKLLPKSVLITILVSNLMKVITGSWILLLKA